MDGNRHFIEFFYKFFILSDALKTKLFRLACKNVSHLSYLLVFCVLR